MVDKEINFSVDGEKTSETSTEIVKVPQYYDVKLVELAGDWCKVSYNGQNG